MEAEPAKKHSKLKLAMAGIGVAYLIGGAVWAGHAYWTGRGAARGPNLAAHPENATQMLVDRELEKFNTQLGFSEDQKRQVREILEKERVVNVPPLEAMQNMVRARGKIREIITPEQAEKLDKIGNERVDRFTDRMVERLKKEVGITEAQEQGIRSIVNEVNPLKGGGNDSEPMPMRFMRARDRVRGLLTPEQQEKFDKMQGPGGGGLGLLRRFGIGQQSQEEN